MDCALRSAERRGFAAVGVFTSSLRDCDAGGTPLALRVLPDIPDMVLNMVSFPLFILGPFDVGNRPRSCRRSKHSGPCSSRPSAAGRAARPGVARAGASLPRKRQ